MGKVNAHRGLCSNCLRMPTCAFPKMASHPIPECNEYKGPPVKTGAPGPGRSRFRVGGTSPRLGAVAVAVAAGLCSNCANLGSCSFPKPRGGVWSCEEYE